MAEAAPAGPSDELLEWPKKDKRRLLHAVYRVGDLDRTIKYASIDLYNLFWCAIVLLLLSFLFFQFYQVLYGVFWDEASAEKGHSRREILQCLSWVWP